MTNDRDIRRCSGCGSWKLVKRSCLTCDIRLQRECVEGFEAKRAARRVSELDLADIRGRIHAWM